MLDQLEDNLKPDFTNIRNRSQAKKKYKIKFIHKVKNDNIDWKKIINWEIIQCTNQKRPGRVCTLCNLKRLENAFADNNKLLNLRSEFLGKRRHTKFYLNFN